MQDTGGSGLKSDYLALFDHIRLRFFNKEAGYAQPATADEVVVEFTVAGVQFTFQSEDQRLACVAEGTSPIVPEHVESLAALDA